MKYLSYSATELVRIAFLIPYSMYSAKDIGERAIFRAIIRSLDRFLDDMPSVCLFWRLTLTGDIVQHLPFLFRDSGPFLFRSRSAFLIPLHCAFPIPQGILIIVEADPYQGSNVLHSMKYLSYSATELVRIAFLIPYSMYSAKDIGERAIFRAIIRSLDRFLDDMPSVCRFWRLTLTRDPSFEGVLLTRSFFE
jgi:hypothetical protein